MSRIKVLGIGSPFGEDRLGWLVVEGLSKHTELGRRCDLECHDRPGVRLIELMADADCVILIDAMHTGQALGSIYRFADEAVFDASLSLSTHHMGVAEALRLALALDMMPPKLIVYGIEIDLNGNGRLTYPVQQAIEKLILLVQDELLDLLGC